MLAGEGRAGDWHRALLPWRHVSRILSVLLKPKAQVLCCCRNVSHLSHFISARCLASLESPALAHVSSDENIFLFITFHRILSVSTDLARVN